ncbi:DUF3039 domain-containing protein [Cryobacterium sp. GrIS_2_6]|uniref:DUF3039 domain-containing protein n=1 Tax=Cryobacterium sp. GrIS_2_6 TaxID=3162785 RepID=UPI002DF8E9A5|nr:hypothetical protein [Cryobacterium psychrotolerans]
MAKDSEIGDLLRRLPPISRLRHPLIQAFDDQFSGADDASTLREAISAVSDRKWWKQTFSSRWRGAATILIEDGSQTVWLGAAGYHRAGSPEDFYSWFAGECTGNSDAFLPQAEDRALQVVDCKVAQLDAWKAQLHLSVLILLANALDTSNAGPLKILRPAVELDALMELSISIETLEEAGEHLTEAILTIVPTERKYANLTGIATRTILASIQPETLEWTTAPLAGEATSYRVLVDQAMSAHARQTRSEGVLAAEDLPGVVRMGTIAHYTPVTGLTEASLEGTAVRAVCGHWFVPMHDHKALLVCLTCANVRDSLPA